MVKRLLLAAFVIALSGCGSTYRPNVSTRLYGNDTRIDVVEARTAPSTWGSQGTSARITLRATLPPGTRLRSVLLVNARVKECALYGLPASAIHLDDADVDAGVAVDVSGEHDVAVSFATGGEALLAGPVALDWYDEVDGAKRCGRIDLVDTTPEHAWTNTTRTSIGMGTTAMIAPEPVGGVTGMLGVPLRVRHRIGERGALGLTLGVLGLGTCSEDVCKKEGDGKQRAGFALPFGLGYDYTLVHEAAFAFGLGARYSPLLTAVPRSSGTETILIHELVAVPRVALVEPRTQPSGLPGASHASSIDLEIPVGAWAGDQLRDVSFVLGAALTLNRGL